MGTVKPKVTVITPVNCWNQYRHDVLKRAVESVDRQKLRNYEHLIIDDGSTFTFPKLDYPKVEVISKQHEERIAAYNLGLERARGEIIMFLDSDDEYEPNYLDRVYYFFNKYPKFKMFNFGARYEHQDGGGWVRDAFKPKKKKVGHEIFGGGTVVNGTYVFHREVYEKLGGYPPIHIQNIDCTEINYGGVRDLYTWTPYDFSAYAQLEFPEIRKFFMVDHVNEPNKIIKELGNPWGNDYYLFYKYTRKYHSLPIDEPLYVVHPKTGAE